MRATEENRGVGREWSWLWKVELEVEKRRHRIQTEGMESLGKGHWISSLGNWILWQRGPARKRFLNGDFRLWPKDTAITIRNVSWL